MKRLFCFFSTQIWRSTSFMLCLIIWRWISDTFIRENYVSFLMDGFFHKFSFNKEWRKQWLRLLHKSGVISLRYQKLWKLLTILWSRWYLGMDLPLLSFNFCCFSFASFVLCTLSFSFNEIFFIFSIGLLLLINWFSSFLYWLIDKHFYKLHGYMEKGVSWLK